MDRAEQAKLGTNGAGRLLSDDDVRLLLALSTGLTIEAAAERFDVSPHALRKRLSTICARLEVNTPMEAVVWAARHGLV